MDRFLKKTLGILKAMKGGAHRALPFWLCLALLGLGAGLRADDAGDTTLDALPVLTPYNGSLDGGARLLYTNPSVLDSLAASAGFPKTGGLWLLWGGGATLTPGNLCIQISAWKGGLNASSAGAATGWNLGLAELTMEQAYLLDNCIFMAGISLESGELGGSFVRGNSTASVESAIFGYGLQGGMRWPAQTPLAFFLGIGWEMLTGPGTWHGDAATGTANLGTTLFELGGPTVTLQLDLSL
ncbi:MAG TPA: hypothetical protein VK914_05450 [bacterium]|jgi:hypothetical protein|nr:hypothetical protein [bacterium]